jgi:hypothetical protein
MIGIYLYNDFPHNSCGLKNHFSKSKFANKNYWVVADPIEADVIIIFDFKENRKLKQFISKHSEKFFVLIRTEPPSVLKSQYTRELPVQLVIDLGKWNYLDNRLIYLEWPICDDFFHHQPKNSVNKEERILFLNSNKFGNFNTYYNLRRKIAYKSEGYVITFGKGWSIFDFQIRNFIGNFIYNLIRFRLTELRLMNFFFREMLCLPKTSHLAKFELFKTFNYVLIIENDTSYMSEKLIEALLLGKTVLYVGSDIDRIPFPISEHIIIPKPSYAEVRKTIEEVYLGKYKTKTLKEDATILLADWNADKVWSKLLEIISQSYSFN